MMSVWNKFLMILTVTPFIVFVIIVSFFLPILSILIQAKRVAIFISRFRASKTSSFLFEDKMVLYSKSVI